MIGEGGLLLMFFAMEHQALGQNGLRHVYILNPKSIIPKIYIYPVVYVGLMDAKDKFLLNSGMLSCD